MGRKCAKSVATQWCVQLRRSKAELEAARHWSAGGVAARPDGKAAFIFGGQGSLRQRKVSAFQFARTDRGRVRIRERNIAKASSPQSRRPDGPRFGPVRLGRVRRGRKRLLGPRLRQGEEERQSRENRPAPHIRTPSVDQLTNNLPNFASSRKSISHRTAILKVPRPGSSHSIFGIARRWGGRLKVARASRSSDQAGRPRGG
jgi:hypothetical protein